MKKTIFAVFSALTMLFALTACNECDHDHAKGHDAKDGDKCCGTGGECCH